MCGCPRDRGNCTVDGVQNASSNPLILLCECTEGKEKNLKYNYNICMLRVTITNSFQLYNPFLFFYKQLMMDSFVKMMLMAVMK